MRAAVWQPVANPPAKVRYAAEKYDLILKEDAPRPKFDASKDTGKVLVRVRAAGLNPIDCKLLVGPTIGGHFPYCGRDFSGVVESVGDKTDTRGIKIGDRVMGCSGIFGTCAEYTVASIETLAKIPEGVPFEKAAGVGVTYLTGYDGLFAQTTKKNRAPINSESKVLIIGASGGTGIAGIQLAKHCAGSRLVIGVCSAKNRERVLKLGADAVLDYNSVDFTSSASRESLDAAVKAALAESGKQDACASFDGFDLIYDCVSSPEDHDYRPVSQKMLNKDGHYVCINSSSGFLWIRALATKAMPSLSPVLLPGKTDLFLPTQTAQKWDQIATWMKEGKIDVQIEKAVDFNGSGDQKLGAKTLNEAVDCQLSRRAVGKVVISNIGPVEGNLNEVVEASKC